MIVPALALLAQAQPTDAERMVLIPWTKAPKEVPVFYSVDAKVEAAVKLGSLSSTQRLSFQVHQGQAKVLTIALRGDGKITEVSGAQLKDWSLRTAADGQRFLDLHPKADKDGNYPAVVEVVVQGQAEWKGAEVLLLLPGPAKATGFGLDVKVIPDPAVDVRVVQIQGMVAVESKGGLHYTSHESSELKLKVSPSGLRMDGMEMISSRLVGRLSDDGKSMSCEFSGIARSEKADATLELLTGRVAVVGDVSGPGWRIGLRKAGKVTWVYDLVAEQEGVFPVSFRFEVPVAVTGDIKHVNFTMPAGVVVPLTLDGFGMGMGMGKQGIEFLPDQDVVPRAEGSRLTGFLPATGRVTLAWRAKDQVEDGSLFFSSSEVTDVRVGSGLMRQRSLIELQVLQGKLNELVFDLKGDGEILAVSGNTSVIGWNVSQSQGQRRLEVKLSRPITKRDQIIVDAQVAMQGQPLQAEAIRLSPVGVLRHSGWLRVANEGSVRLEVVDAKGLIQLAPHQFPAKQEADLRQVVVYRFPTADYAYRVNASQVLPEIAVSEVTVYELGESDRRIHTDIELDIHEAPVREWALEIPEDHAVSSVAGAQVADYAVGSEVRSGMRTLNIIFKGPVMDRQLIRVVMTKNEAPQAGAWKIRPLGFPEVKSRRGYIGAVAAAGYRLEVAKSSGMAEVPLTFFPKKFSGLQQAFRLREESWALELKVEALEQSILADVFHLYRLKSGAVYGSVVINYFVVGAPATEWRIEVPEGIGNIDVTGQHVGRDWRQAGNTVIVPLSRPVLGAGTVLLTFEEPMNPRGGKLSPGAVRPLGVQGERGVIQVVSPLQVNHKSTHQGALLEIDSSEIPTEFQLLSGASTGAPTLGAWQYTARDFELGMEIEWFDPGETIEQVVDFQKLETRISRDGQWVTDSQIFVKSRGRSTLRMKLPEGSVLWEAKVSGKAVNARTDGDEILVPLPAKVDLNKALEISLRYGAKSEKPSRPVLAAPQFEVPVVIGEWTVSGDEGRQLVPIGGTANLVKPVQAQTGWQWMAQHEMLGLLLLLAGVLSLVLGRDASGGALTIAALVAGLFFIVVALLASGQAGSTADSGSQVLEYAAPVVAPGQAVTVEVANSAEWIARTGLAVWLGFAIGIAIALRGLLVDDRWWLGCGMSAVVASFLSIHGGAGVFFVVVAIAGAAWWLPLLVKSVCIWKKKAGSAPTAAATMLVAMLAWGSATPLEAAPEPDEVKTAETVNHDWKIKDGRLYGSATITLTGQQGDRYLLLQHPAVLKQFSGEDLKLVKGMHGQAHAYWLVALKSGRLSGKAVFEMPVDPANGWLLPSGPAAVQQVKLTWDQGGWEFSSPQAVRIEQQAAKSSSGALMVFSPRSEVTLKARALQRDVASEETRFFTEVANLFVPGPGVVNGRHRVTIRPAQGRVDTLTLHVPQGFTVSEVYQGPVGNWRFDPDSRELKVSVQPAQISDFAFTVETQQSTGDLPVDLQVTPMRVEGAAGEVGMIGMAFGDEVQPEALKPVGLSKVNPEDFNAGLIPLDRAGKPSAILLHAFRHGPGKASLAMRVNPVAPELRSQIWQLVSIGEDRLVVTADLEVLITRSGVFKLMLEVPEALEVESASGEGLSHWTQISADGKRMVTLHLSGKTIGKRKFSLTLVGRPVDENESWMVPKVRLQDASRETGMLTVVPERGLQVRAVKRKNITQMDPREVAGMQQQIARAAVRPEALSYRLLQGDWELGLSIRRLEPWVTARVFHDATIREGQVLTRLNIAYRIDNAAVKSQQIRIPGLDEKSAATVRATGAAVADCVAIDAAKGLWEIRFRRGIAGRTEVMLEYQRPSGESGEESIVPASLVDVRQTNYILSLRAGGRLELQTNGLPRGWQRTDWSAIQGLLGNAAGGEPPNMTFKVADPEGPLSVIMKRHELANLRKIRVSKGTLTSLLSPGGNVLTAAVMHIQVVGKSTMRLQLPAGAELFNVFVNDAGAPLVREGDDWLFYVFPSPDASKQTEVRFVYSAVMGKGGKLQGPVLDVPMENLTWRVLVPEGWRLADHDGDFDLTEEEDRGSFSLVDYQSFASIKSTSENKSMEQTLDQGNNWAQAGDQEKAIMAFRNVLNNGKLDAASNEDARVQLRRIKTQQAVLGLNSRRQKMMLDNRGVSQQQEINPQIDQAAAANPVLQGQYNFDPRQFDRLLEGNTEDEIAAITAIANRIVAQQLAAEPAPAALDITLPERGTVLSFTRSVQVGSDEPMSMEIELERSGGGFSLIAVLLCLTVGAIGVIRRTSTK